MKVKLQNYIILPRTLINMEIFHPSVFLAIFPYLFMGSFPVFGLILVTKWIVDDIKKKKSELSI